MNHYGVMYMYDFDSWPSAYFQLSDEECLELAGKGQAELQYEYATRLMNKHGTNLDIALDWLVKAADQNYLPAFAKLGFCYERGQDVEKNEERAKYWYSKIDETYLARAEQGDAEAQFAVGNAFFHGGHAIQKDLNQVFNWWLMAAENGHVAAQVSVADSFMYGRFAEPDVEEALFWYTEAANADDPYAQYQLGKYYITGTVTPDVDMEFDENYGRRYFTVFDSDHDFELAVTWFRKAAEAGNTNARFELGKCYYHGIGVPEDSEEAYKWFAHASGDGHNEARHIQDKMFSDMMDEEYEQYKLSEQTLAA